MKIIKQSKLRYTSGKSDKVYEVSLLQLSSLGERRYLVNTRYGRYGANLREGTKTNSPVDWEEAESLFLSVVVAKLNKGYQLVSGFDPAIPYPQPVVSAVSNSESVIQKPMQAREIRTQVILAKLEQAIRKDDKAALQRLVWRCGELQLAASLPLLLQMQLRHKAILAYTLAWSLGRCGQQNEQAFRRLQALAAHQSFYVQRMARQALVAIAPTPQQHNLLDHIAHELPATWHEAVEQGADALLALLRAARPVPYRNRKYAQSRTAKPLETGAVQLDLLNVYLLAWYRKPHWQPVLLQLASQLLRDADTVWIWRVLFKLAEFQQDHKLWAVLIKQLERSKPLLHEWSQVYPIYGRKTRDYFRRRSWRLLRKLGLQNDANFVKWACELLLQYHDGDEQSGCTHHVYYERVENRGRYERREEKCDYAPFATHLAFNQLLYRHSEVYQANASHSFWWHKADQSDASLRTEAFPALWDQHLVAVLDLLGASRCEAVHAVMIKVLHAHPDFCKTLSAAAWLPLLQCAYEMSAAFALEVVQHEHPLAIKELSFITQVFNAATKTVRKAAQRWLSQVSETVLWEDSTWLVALIMSPYVDNREFSRAYCEHIPKQSFRQSLCGRLLAAMQASSPSSELDAAVAEQVLWVLSQALKVELAQLSLTLVRDLLQHPLAVVQVLGAEIIVAKRLSPKTIPADIYALLVNSPHESVRAIAVRLLENLSPAELADMPDVLLELLQVDSTPIRTEALQVVQHVAPHQPECAKYLLQALIPVLFAAEPYEGVHDTAVTCVTQYLDVAWEYVDNDLLWRLLQAQSKAAQRAATAILLPRSPAIYSVRQWARLGKHASLQVREWAQQAYREQPQAIAAHFNDALRLLDTDWDDSRTFALNYFAQQFGAEQWQTERLIFLCDSVRDDVQRLGRDLLIQFFVDEQGADYLLKLSQHPSRNVQLFASQFLQSYATGRPDLQQQLKLYFTSVLSAVNQGRVSKERVMDFLLTEAKANLHSATLLADILTRQSVTVAIQDKARFIAGLRDLKQQYPQLFLPIEYKQRPLRGYQPHVSEVT